MFNGRDRLKQAQAMAAALIRTKGPVSPSRSGWANFQVPHNGSGSRQEATASPSQRITTSGLPTDGDDTVLASRQRTADTVFAAACLAGPPIISENRENVSRSSAMLLPSLSI